MDTLTLIVICFVYFVLGYVYAIKRISKKSKDFLEHIQKSALEKQGFKITEFEGNQVIARTGIELVHEVINNTHYFYKEHDMSFVCQGNSLEEAAKVFHERNGNTAGYFINTIDNKTLYFIDGKILDQGKVVKL